MHDTVIVQYVGFEVKTLVREYNFVVLEAPNEPRKFKLTIVNEAFNSHRVRFQDAPDICSVKLRHELAVSANNPLETEYRISEADLDDYRDSHSPKSKNRMYPSKIDRDR